MIMFRDGGNPFLSKATEPYNRGAVLKLLRGKHREFFRSLLTSITDGNLKTESYLPPELLTTNWDLRPSAHSDFTVLAGEFDSPCDLWRGLL